MPRVISSAILWIGYDVKRGTLFIRFISGDLYSYEDVPERLYQEFLRADSKGYFFQERISGRFVDRRLEEDLPWDGGAPAREDRSAA